MKKHLYWVKSNEYQSRAFRYFAPNIVPHLKMKKHLYCAMTKTTLPMDPKKVQAHVASKRFQEGKKIQDDNAAVAATKAEEKKKRKDKFREERVAKAKAEGKELPAKKKGDGEKGDDSKAKKKKNKKHKLKRKGAEAAGSTGDSSAPATDVSE